MVVVIVFFETLLMTSWAHLCANRSLWVGLAVPFDHCVSNRRFPSCGSEFHMIFASWKVVITMNFLTTSPTKVCSTLGTVHHVTASNSLHSHAALWTVLINTLLLHLADKWQVTQHNFMLLFFFPLFSFIMSLLLGIFPFHGFLMSWPFGQFFIIWIWLICKTRLSRVLWFIAFSAKCKEAICTATKFQIAILINNNCYITTWTIAYVTHDNQCFI